MKTFKFLSGGGANYDNLIDYFVDYVVASSLIKEGGLSI